MWENFKVDMVVEPIYRFLLVSVIVGLEFHRIRNMPHQVLE